MTRALAALLASGVVACSGGQQEAPVVTALTVVIDAANDCSLEKQVVDCAQVPAAIKERYPTSRPRVDICLDPQTRYEAAIEVMDAVGAAGLTVGSFGCDQRNAG